MARSLPVALCCAAALAVTPPAVAQADLALLDLTAAVTPALDEAAASRSWTWTGTGSFSGLIEGTLACSVRGFSNDARLGGGGGGGVIGATVGTCGDRLEFEIVQWNRWGEAVYLRGSTRVDGRRRTYAGTCATDVLTRPVPTSEYRIQCAVSY